MERPESPWRPIVWKREYRFPDIGQVVTVKAEMEADDWLFWFSGLKYESARRAGRASPDYRDAEVARRFIRNRMNAKMRAEAERHAASP